MESRITHLTKNGIKNKIENNDSTLMTLQIVDHKVFGPEEGKKGIKSR